MAWCIIDSAERRSFPRPYRAVNFLATNSVSQGSRLISCDNGAPRLQGNGTTGANHPDSARGVPPVNVICMKWGTLYGPHYVNRLYGMTTRHLSRPFRFVCFTDDSSGLRDEFETVPLPEIRVDAPYQNLPWRKLAVFREAVGGLSGTTLFLDLDVVIVGTLDPFFDYFGEFCIIREWSDSERIVGNSSVFRFEIGAHADLLDRYESKPTRHWIELYGVEQTYLSHALGPDRLTYWPADWCVSFKKHCLARGMGGLLWNWLRPAKIPAGARIIAFHGTPNPHEAAAGAWPGCWYRHLRPVSWIDDHWRE